MKRIDIELVPAAAKVTASATAQVDHLCPFKDETDEGSVTIIWDCAGDTVELHSLSLFLAAFAFEKISHEDLVGEIFARFEALAPRVVIRSVTARFTTAGIDVEVRRGPVHVDAIGA